MKRRDFVKMMAVGTAATAGLGMGVTSAFAAKKKPAAPAIKKLKLSKQKEWAIEEYKGMANFILPSMSPDFKTLDEEAVRADVQNSIRHGMLASVLYPVGFHKPVETEQHIQTIKIICDEARGKKLFPGTCIGAQTEAEDMAMLAGVENIGCSHLLVHLDRSGICKTEEELYEKYKKRIEATSIPVFLFAMVAPWYKKFGPSGIPIRVFDKLADLPNVVGVKFSQPMNLATAFQCCEAFSDRLSVGVVNLDFAPMLSKFYNVQWSGQWQVEAVQSPEKPYCVEMMRLLNARKYTEAMKVYNQFSPALDYFFDLQAPTILKHVSPWPHRKYFQWCTGGNGGLIYIDNPRYRHQYVPILDAAAREKVKETYRSIGIEPYNGPEEEFMVGKAAYKRGVRAKDLAHTQYYKA
ncbi:MAG: dihydrodipicolinate synthase family protein [Deltaproteobacteria bacterium]